MKRGKLNLFLAFSENYMGVFLRSHNKEIGFPPESTPYLLRGGNDIVGSITIR